MFWRNCSQKSIGFEIFWPLKCDQCDYTSLVKRNFIKHVKIAHTKREKNLLCDQACVISVSFSIFLGKKNLEKRPPKITATYEDIENLSPLDFCRYIRGHLYTTNECFEAFLNHPSIYVRTFSLLKLVREKCHILDHPHLN